MSSSSGDEFFDDTGSESEGNEEVRRKVDNALREKSQCNSVSAEESFTNDDGTNGNKNYPDDPHPTTPTPVPTDLPTSNTDDDNDEDNLKDDNDDNDDDTDGNFISKSVLEESQSERYEGSGPEGSIVDEHDRSEELERLFGTPSADITSISPSPKPSASARCRVRLVVEPVPGDSSSQKDPTGTQVKEAGGKDDHPSPLIVVKSPMHIRPPGKPRSKGASPRSPSSPRTPPTTNRNGLNQILCKKESAIAGRGPMGLGGTSNRPRLNLCSDNVGRQQPRQRPLGKYTRSLQMLGVKVPPVVPPVQRVGRSSSSQSWASGRTLYTRLTRRSTSLEDVTRAIPQVKTPEVLHRLHVDNEQRATLSQAIYEEWYFSRRQQIHALKAKIREEARMEKERREKAKNMKESKVSAAVSEWEKNKEEQMQHEKEKLKKSAKKKVDEVKAKDKKTMQVSTALTIWEKEKRELDAKKREKRKLVQEAKSEVAKQKHANKEVAEMVYKMWRQKKFAELRERQTKDKQKEGKLAWEKGNDERMKREEANLAFNAWTKTKLKEDREDTRKIIEESEQRSSEAKSREERSQEALEAYEAWLDHVEDREPLRLYEDARVTAEINGRPPWWPGGSNSSLLRC